MIQFAKKKQTKKTKTLNSTWTIPSFLIQITVRIMGMDDKLHLKMFEDNLALIDTPLIATATSTHYPGTVTTSLHTLHGILLYPFNVSDFQQRHTAAPTGHESAAGALDVIDTGNSYGYDQGIGHSSSGHGHSHGNGASGSASGNVYYQSMCKCLALYKYMHTYVHT